MILPLSPDKAFHAALFDLDGVLVDSEPLYTGFWLSMEDLYPTGIPDFALAIKGTTLTKILSNYADEDVRCDIVARLHNFEDNMAFPLFDDAVPFLEALKHRGIAIAIVTSSDNWKMERLWRQHPRLKEMVNVVITGSMVTRSKPHPEGYLAAAVALGVDPADAVVFEDSLQGVRAGLDSGATVVALATTNPRKSLEALTPYVVERLREISLL